MRATPPCVLVLALVVLLLDSSTAFVRTLRQILRFTVDSSFESPAAPPGKWDLDLRSPCKINLFLRIKGRRPTGYHELASLFQCVSLSDYLYFSRLPASASEDEMTCSDTSLSIDNSNLVLKALNLMREKTGTRAHFRVHLEKTVPMQAGLGGGSGNAATAMYAFNALNNFASSNEQLKLWSGDIGSDITFFFSTGTAYCTGRGEVVTPLPALPEAAQSVVHIFKPIEGLSTALVFKALQLDSVSRVSPESLLDCFESSGAIKAAGEGRLVNDLEPPAYSVEPKLSQLKARLEQTGAFAGVMMSGSGTSIYAVARTGDRQDEIDRHVKEVLEDVPSMRYYPCSFLNKEDKVDAWYQ